MVLVRLVQGGGSSPTCTGGVLVGGGSENLKKKSKKNCQFFLKCTRRLYIGKMRSRIFWVSKKSIPHFTYIQKMCAFREKIKNFIDLFFFCVD